LEIGCGFGSFLNRLSAEGIVAHGLEINQKAVEKAKSKGLQVESTNLSEYSDSQQGKYDVVCMFQVLEHVSDLKPIITQSLNLLKPNGRLIISVPNNDSFIGFDNRNCLNMPPHHTGLWNQAAFEKLDRFFKMSLLKIILEPLADYHLDWYLGVKSKNSKYLGLLIQKFPKLSKFLTNIFRKHIKGHSIIAIYTKK
jgi:2-polyprenyl-3-methyl-5-hydroxy-6-metoxy-1,4-benzoquinol methylase